MPTIRRLTGLEILDSRGRPTVQATCELTSGAVGRASVPSGASTGTAEALELRDGDPARYRGLGCRKAVSHVNGELHGACSGRTFGEQADLDRTLIELDGTGNKARLGANALLAVSLAFTRAAAAERGVPLYAHFADLLGQPPRTLPRPMINLFSGGKHAGGQIPIQDVLVVPVAARTVDEALALTFDVYQAAVELTARKYGMRALTADEGGLAPPYASAEEMLDDAVEAIRRAGREPGSEVAIAVDVASSHFYLGGRYHLEQDPLTSAAMIERLQGWLTRYPIVSVEDGLAEEDWASWPALREGLEGRALVLGDDLLCTNPQRITRAVTDHAANALLLKVNQVGTLTEAAEANRLARSAGWSVTVSARSGETEDDWLADLAVGWAGDFIKIGSITHGERLAKYNRLLAIEAVTGLPLVAWPTPEHGKGRVTGAEVSQTRTMTPSDTQRIRTPVQERSRQSYERMLDAATELLLQEGYEQVTLVNVSARTGMSNGAFYARFRSKDDLLTAVQIRILERLEAAETRMLTELQAENLPLERLVPRLIDALGEFMKEHADLLRPFMAQAAFDPQVAERGLGGLRKLEQDFQAILLAQRQAIRYPDAEHAALACFRPAFATFARYLGLGSSMASAGGGDWDTLKRDLGLMCLAFLCWPDSSSTPFPQE